MTVSLKGIRYRLELWIDKDGNVEDEAFAYPIMTRPAEGALPKQEAATAVKFRPSDALKAALKTEQRSKVDAELAR